MTAPVVVGRVIATERRKSSRNGNPAFMLTIQRPDGELRQHRTATDSMLAYAIENPEYRDTVHVFGLNNRDQVITAQIACEARNGNHSGDLRVVYRGAALPVHVCGFHAMQL